MQAVLCIDLSGSNFRAQVVEVFGRTLRVVASSLADSSPGPDLTASEQQPETSADLGVATNESSDLKTTEPLPLKSQTLKSILDKLTTPWTTVLLVVSGSQYLSLRLELPFSDNRKLNKILGSEVQDKIPFEVDEFQLDPKVQQQSPDGLYQVQVGLVPKKIISEALDTCRDLGLEPLVVTTASGLLDGLFFVGNDYFPRNSVLIAIHEKTEIFLLARVNGKTVTDRVIIVAPQAKEPAESVAKDQGAAIFLQSEIKLSIYAWEAQFKEQFEGVYVTGGDSNEVNALVMKLKASIGRPVEALALTDFAAKGDRALTLLSFGSVFVQDTEAPQNLINMRTGEFSYSPQLRDLKEGARKSIPYLALTVLIIIFYGLSVYGLWAYRIETMREAFVAMAQEIIPTVRMPSPGPAGGKVSDQLRPEIFTLERQLADLGSPSAFSPYDAFTALTQDFPTGTQVNIERLIIRGNSIELTGKAPDYSAVEKIQNALEQKRQTYCRVRKDTSGSGGAQRVFTLEIRLCE